MKNVVKYYKSILFRALFLFVLPALIYAQTPTTAPENEVVTKFENQTKEYVDLRESLEQQLPPLSKEASAEEIKKHRDDFQNLVKKNRKKSRQGDIFTSEASVYFKNLILGVLNDIDSKNLIQQIFEPEIKNIKVKVNNAYPDSKEQVEMPPDLLKIFPKLPKQLRYKFVGSNLILVDRENELIIDFIKDALPSDQSKTVAVNPKDDKDSVGTVPDVIPVLSPINLPMKEGSVKFLAFGDSGNGAKVQYELGKLMLDYHKIFPYTFALMMGDNIYYSQTPADMKTKFADIYLPIINEGVKFHAVLGNHDESNQRFYEYFNMNGQEYYHFNEGNVSFYALNSNYMDTRQVKWFEDELKKDTSDWKIAYFHHPPYSSGKKHGSSTGLRKTLEPLFIKYGVKIVLNGHEHFYERIIPENGIQYFITGSGGQLRKGDIKRDSPLLADGFDDDLSFMLFEIIGNEAHYQVISRTGATVDSGVITREQAKSVGQ